MISRPLRIGLVFFGTACAHHRGTIRVFQDCNQMGYCTDVQFAAVTESTLVAESEWPSYGRTPYGDRHSPVDQIDAGNVSKLEIAWRFHTGEGAPEFKTRAPTALEVTPLVFRGTMYLSTPLGRVFALDPVTGAQRWVFDPQIDRTTQFGDFANRGVALWLDDAAVVGSRCSLRVFVATIDTRLIALDAATGSPCADFGAGGTVGLRDGLRNQPAFASEYEETSPPTVVDGVVVVGSAVADNNRTDAASGEVRGFDARTGALRWTFDPVPQNSADPASATWIGPNAHRSGAANSWTVFAADPVRKTVYIATGSPSVDYFGGERKGRNEYGNSVVAIQAGTGKVLWHFQTVRHDLWDYDNASPPALVTINVGGRPVPVVLQGTKTGQLFVLDRDTGAPVFPVTAGAAPSSDVAGEEAWPTQILSSGLPPLSPQTLTRDQIWGATAKDRDACRKRFDELRYDGIFTPPSTRGSLIIPSNVGGAHWGGVAFDPANDVVVVPTNRIAAVITLIPRAAFEATRGRATIGERIGTEYAMMHGTPFVLKRELFLAPSGAPCTPPPFGALVALSLRSHQILWSVPLGTSEGLDKIGIHLPPDIPGAINLGGPITTAGGLVFIGATLDPYFRAYDLKNGRELWKAALPAGGKATPMTYLGSDGRQYVVIAAGGDGKAWGWSDQVIAFALPRPAR
ncbi:MAG TPA: pyrroloquinoline quinone-dependent dehydrogenase [Gemmatimonadetes bacterium]|nr:pyrroloquinoline quinone-dependent dehydrogenase [Gemmatimonadota bacterium]